MTVPWILMTSAVLRWIAWWRLENLSFIVRPCRSFLEKWCTGFDVVIVSCSFSYGLFERDLDTITLRDLIDSDGKLIPEDPQPGVPRVGIPRPPRASMYDLYDMMDICQEMIERMEYHGVVEHMAGVYSVPLQRAYNPPGYAQPQYDQQYLPPPPQYPPQYQQQQDDE
nr:hypothetical protein [Tanacetum cinerariifolium]